MIAIFSSDNNLEMIFESLKSESLLLITEKPKTKGRGLKVSPNVADIFAKSKNIPIHYWDNRNPDFAKRLASTIESMQISIGVICSFGQIIPSNILNLFPYGILNIHPSLLPKYRGASPIASAILSGDKVTGYTVILARAGLDTGPVVGQKQVSISSSDDHESLKRKIMSEVQHDLPQIISNYLTGVTKPKPQKIKGVTYTKKFKKTDGEISNADDAVSADRKIRAFSRWPKAYLMLGGKRLIVHSAHLNKNKLALDQIQLEGKRVMDFADFRRGYPNLLTKMPKFVSLL